MTQISRIKEWRGATSDSHTYERLLATLGTPAFGGVVREAVLARTAGLRRLYLFEATARDRSTLQYTSVEASILPLLPEYRRCHQPADPLGEVFAAAPLRGDMAVQRVEPADIAAGSFRRQFFDAPGIIERIAIIQRGEDGWRGLNIARHRSSGKCSDDELTTLIALAGLVLPMLPVNRQRHGPAVAPDVAELEQRFAARCAALTARERQVCARACAGFSIDATARELGVGRTSVVTYRQRAYQRLGVSNTLALRALVTH